MITYYEDPFKEQAHIHSLDGKMDEITILVKRCKGSRRFLSLITTASDVQQYSIVSPAPITPMISLE